MHERHPRFLRRDRPARRELKGAAYESFMLLISLLSMINSVVIVLAWLLMPGTGPAQQVMLVVEWAMTPFFLFDFAYRLLTDPSRAGYFVRRWGWADLVAAVPMLGVFRLFRVRRVIRLIRAYDRDRFIDDLVIQRARATFLFTVVMVILVVEIAGAFIFWAESGAPDANIRSASDAIWWGLVTITTVGYGDEYPVTEQGRVIGVLLLFAGIGLFSVLTGFIANFFLAPRPRRRFRVADDDPRAAIEAIRDLLAEQEARSQEIRSQLEQLDRVLAADRSVDPSSS